MPVAGGGRRLWRGTTVRLCLMPLNCARKTVRTVTVCYMCISPLKTDFTIGRKKERNGLHRPGPWDPGPAHRQTVSPAAGHPSPNGAGQARALVGTVSRRAVRTPRGPLKGPAVSSPREVWQAPT